MKVSVVVPTIGKPDFISSCLASLLNQNYPKDKYEVIVVDSSSDDGVRKLIEMLNQNLETPKLICLPQDKKGPAAARNLGLIHSEGDFICFIDDDCVADEYWIKNLLSGYSSNKIGGVGGKIVGLNSKKVLEKFQDCLFVPKLINGEYLPAINTSNASYRKSVLLEVGGFDEDFITNEDTELSHRVRKRGYLLKYVPNAIVYHRHRDTLTTLLRREFNLGKGAVQLCFKHRPDFTITGLFIVNIAKILINLFMYPVTVARTPFVDDKLLFLSKPFLYILVRLGRLMGYTYALKARIYERGNERSREDS